MWRGRGALGAASGAILSLFGFSVVGARAARAQEVIALKPPIAVAAMGDPEIESARSRVEEARPERPSEPSPLEHRSILLELGTLRLPPIGAGRALVNEIAPEADAPGTVVRTYRGLQGVLYRRAMGYYHRLATDTLRSLWAGTSISAMQFQEDLDYVGAQEADFFAGGRWWERTWRQSLLPEKGGAPATPRVIEIGKEIELFRVGELAFTTEGKLRAGRLSVYLSDDKVYEKIRAPLDNLNAAQSRARSDAHLARGPAAPTPAPDVNAPKPRPSTDDARIDLSIALEDDAEVELERSLRGTLRARVLRRFANGPARGNTPRGNVWTGDGWNVSFRPTLQLRLPQLGDLPSAVSQAAAEVEVSFFPRELREPWAILVFKVRGAPSPREVTACVDFEVVRW
jgi:hypothetical protein